MTDRAHAVARFGDGDPVAALGDALAIALLESRGFTALDFGALHPGGRLGALLKFARDVMHTGDAMPLALPGTQMSEAIVEMSTKGFGCVGIQDRDGRLLGIITDGDLRRHMDTQADVRELSASHVMTRDPVTIPSATLAVEALNLMELRKITSIVVVEGPSRHVVGVVHLHDLWRTEMI